MKLKLTVFHFSKSTHLKAPCSRKGLIASTLLRDSRHYKLVTARRCSLLQVMQPVIRNGALVT